MVDEKDIVFPLAATTWPSTALRWYQCSYHWYHNHIDEQCGSEIARHPFWCTRVPVALQWHFNNLVAVGWTF